MEHNRSSYYPTIGSVSINNSSMITTTAGSNRRQVNYFNVGLGTPGTSGARFTAVNGISIVEPDSVASIMDTRDDCQPAPDNNLIVNSLLQLIASVNSLQEEMREFKAAQSVRVRINEGNGDAPGIPESDVPVDRVPVISVVSDGPKKSKVPKLITCGPKKPLKRLNAPKSWKLDKLIVATPLVTIEPEQQPEQAKKLKKAGKPKKRKKKAAAGGEGNPGGNPSSEKAKKAKSAEKKAVKKPKSAKKAKQSAEKKDKTPKAKLAKKPKAKRPKSLKKVRKPKKERPRKKRRKQRQWKRRKKTFLYLIGFKVSPYLWLIINR